MTKTSSYPTTAADAVRTYAGALEAHHLPKWTKGKDIETEVVVRNNNRIDVVVSPNYNCTVEVTIRLTYDSFFPLYPWSVEVDLPPQKHMNDRRITEYADFLRKVGRVMDEIETLGNYKYRKV